VAALPRILTSHLYLKISSIFLELFAQIVLTVHVVKTVPKSPDSPERNRRMDSMIAKEVTRLLHLSPKDLRLRYAELFAECTHTGNKGWLIKRIAWRLQALAEGDLSERARDRARELACDADLRLSPPEPIKIPLCAVAELLGTPSIQSDPRLPPPGSTLVRKYKGQAVRVKVLSQGFEYHGITYESLSAVAQAITGTHWNGILFFRLNRKGGKS
jgi:hypothetical protein